MRHLAQTRRRAHTVRAVSPVTFTDTEIDALRRSFGAIARVNTDALPGFHAVLDAMTDQQLAQVCTAGITWLSSLAINERRRRAAANAAVAIAATAAHVTTA